jgi:proteasome accessory factor A
MSEWSAFLKVGATDLVLAMVEEATVLRDLTLDNPIRAIREISHDMTCRRKVRLANNREASALDIQREYFEKAARFVDRRDAGETAKKVIDMWGHALDALENQDLDAIGRQVDWVTKYLLIERARDRHNLPLSHPKIALIDLTYHDVNRKRGLYYLLERSGAVERVCDDRAIDRATQEPPQTTRARLRGEFIRQAKERRRDYTVDWVHLKLNDQAQRTVLCKDPFRAYDDRVDKLIASM